MEQEALGSRKRRGNIPSNKVGAATVGSAVATIVWILLVNFVPAVKNASLSDTTIAGLTGATATVVAFVLGYFVPERY